MYSPLLFAAMGAFLSFPLKRHNNTATQTAQRRRRLGDSFGPELALQFGLGTHYTEIYVGFPPQRVSVIADTGSELTAFPCHACDGCGQHTDPPFDEEKSSTHKSIGCTHRACVAIKAHKCTARKQCALYKHYYEGSSWNAVAVEDLLWTLDPTSLPTVDEAATKTHALRFFFGCQNAATGLFRTQVANGIMGFADTPNNLVRQLVSESHLQHNIFSMCYTVLWPRVHKAPAGVLVLGGTDTRLHNSPMVYAKRLRQHPMMGSHTGIYMVSILDILVNDVSIGTLPKAARAGIVDSGTQDSYCPSAIASMFASTWRKQLDPSLKPVVGNFDAAGGVLLMPQHRKKMPVIKFVLQSDTGGKTVITMPPDHYIEPQQATLGGCRTASCMYKITLRHTDPYSSPCTFGANLMQGHDVSFDMDNERIGFAESKCQMPGPDRAGKVTLKSFGRKEGRDVVLSDAKQ